MQLIMNDQLFQFLATRDSVLFYFFKTFSAWQSFRETPLPNCCQTATMTTPHPHEDQAQEQNNNDVKTQIEEQLVYLIMRVP